MLDLTLDISKWSSKESLSLQEKTLVWLVALAHRNSADENANVSTNAYVSSVLLTDNPMMGIVAACATLGGMHAPISKARLVYEIFDDSLIHTYSECTSLKVAGFGNSFYKDGIDPKWQDVDDYITGNFPKVAKRIQDLTLLMHKYGMVLYPNAALYTGAMCSLLEFKKGTEESFVVLTRLPCWVEKGLDA